MVGFDEKLCQAETSSNIISLFSVESTNSRVLYFSIFSMCCLLGLATWQVLYLRRFFKAKKLIEWSKCGSTWFCYKNCHAFCFVFLAPIISDVGQLQRAITQKRSRVECLHVYFCLLNYIKSALIFNKFTIKTELFKINHLGFLIREDGPKLSLHLNNRCKRYHN